MHFAHRPASSVLDLKTRCTRHKQWTGVLPWVAHEIHLELHSTSIGKDNRPTLLLENQRSKCTMRRLVTVPENRSFLPGTVSDQSCTNSKNRTNVPCSERCVVDTVAMECMIRGEWRAYQPSLNHGRLVNGEKGENGMG